MSYPSKPSSQLPISAKSMAILLTLVALFSLFGVSLLLSGWNNSNPIQLGARPIQQFATTTPATILALQETVVPAASVEPLPTLEEIIISAPEVTPYPTYDPAFVPTIAPTADWLTYTDEIGRFSIRYSNGWDVDELPSEIRQTAGSYTTMIGNYDAEDPSLADLKDFPPQLFKVELTIEKPGTSGVPIPANYDLEQWANEFRKIGGEVEWIEAGYVAISGVEGYRVVWEDSTGLRGVAIWVPHSDNLFSFTYGVSSDYPELVEAAEQIVASFQFVP